jgi:hypothetical protein
MAARRMESTGPVSAALRGFKTRTLPVCRSVCTGSASAISCSIFFSGSDGRGGVSARGGAICGVPVPVASVRPVGGRNTTPCVAGRVGVAIGFGSIRIGAGTAMGLAGGTGAGSATGLEGEATVADAGTGLIVGG